MTSTLKTAIFGRQARALVPALLFALSLAQPAQATIIPPGPGAFPPDIFAGCPGCTLLAFIDSGPVTTGSLTFDLISAVLSDPANIFGAGDLDFVYQVSNSRSSTDSIGRVTTIDFTGFATDVGYTVTGSSLPGGFFVDGTVTPQLVDRVSADVVGFSFNAPLSLLVAPGTTSVPLAIETDAINFKAGTANIIDGHVASVAAFAPASPSTVPEPASVLLSSMGLLSMAFFRRVGFGRRR